MSSRFSTKRLQDYWENSVLTRVSEWNAEALHSAITSHSLILTGLLAVCIFQYYIDQTVLTGIPFFKDSFFTGVHDINRALFLIPVIYSAIVFRVRGSLIVSVVFLAAILPRALFISTYPNPLYRALTFVAISALIGFLVATGINKIENDKKNRDRLTLANKKLNDYIEKLKESQEQLIHADKLTSVGQLAASIAHEVNNPLSGILVYTQLLQKKLADGSVSTETAQEYLSKMEFELIRSTRMVRNLLNFARQSPPSFSKIDLNAVVNRAYELAANAAKKQRIETTKELDESLPQMEGDFDQLLQVCTNLILNAVQAMPGGGKLTLRSSYADGRFKVEVQDTGGGISEDNMKKLFTPFFTTKQEIKGVGLGLAISYDIVQRHHGSINVESREGQGSVFTLDLPAQQEEADNPAAL